MFSFYILIVSIFGTKSIERSIAKIKDICIAVFFEFNRAGIHRDMEICVHSKAACSGPIHTFSFLVTIEDRFMPVMVIHPGENKLTLDPHEALPENQTMIGQGRDSPGVPWATGLNQVPWRPGTVHNRQMICSLSVSTDTLKPNSLIDATIIVTWKSGCFLGLFS
jgi:hypothetical protein